MDFNSIDLTPFEDPSVPWTAEYSNLLQLKNHPRDYQIEIIRDAVRSGNTIVCLRTGSGKTFIASILIKYHYIKQQKTNPGSAFFTLFFVPRKAIRLQQAKAISGVGNLKVQICEDDQTIDKLIGTNHVVVSTPQKFVNCLKNGKLFLAQINLMIFDECHNTSGANPYCEILKFYLCPSRKQNTGDKPLIIGLTATVSAKDAVEKKDTIRNNLVALCSKLSCQTISTVCDPNNIIEINRKISRPLNDQFQFVLKVKYNSHFDEYKKMFDDLITQIKQHLDGHEVLDGHEIGSSSFIGQLVFLKQSFEKKGQINNIVICDYLSFLTKKYSALKDLPFDMVIKHMIQKIHEYHQSFQEPVPMDNLLYERCATELEAIVEKHKEHPTTNSKLDDLVKLLRQHAQGGTKGDSFSHVILFSNYDFVRCRTCFGTNNILRKNTL
jgi:ERCC4-related helicase